MRVRIRFPVFLVTCLGSGGIFANGFTAQSGNPTFATSISLQNYVNKISTYQPETPELLARLQKSIDYYRRVHILKTVAKKSYTVDCIPFAEQPALIDNPSRAAELLSEEEAYTKENIEALKIAGSNFDFNPATECPLGSVAILRPTKIMLTSEKANTKVAPHATPSISTSTYTWEQGYSTQTGALVYIQTQQNSAYFMGPQNQTVSPYAFEDHSLDQFWLTSNPYVSPLYSVEFGIIASSYWTYPPSTSIFVFASVDGYGSNSCYDSPASGCPNFTLNANTPALGSHLTNLTGDYVFQVAYVTPRGNPQYALTLVTHNISPPTPILLGHYSASVYPPGVSLTYFSAGAEVTAATAQNGTIMYGNYAYPYYGYCSSGSPCYLGIGLTTENNNPFPAYESYVPNYGVVWHLGQNPPSLEVSNN